MTGIEISSDDVRLLDQMGNANLLVDRSVWPMAATRRVAARGGGYSASVLTGLAMMGSPMLAGEAAGGCARFLHRARARVKEGGTVASLVEEILARRERVMGFGRPVVGPDERVPIMRSVLVQHGRAALPFVTMLNEADDAFFAGRGLRMTSAALAAAILCDYGMNPDQVHAVANYWVHVNVYAQGLFSGERGVRSDV
jgi:citrate synthase